MTAKSTRLEVANILNELESLWSVTADECMNTSRDHVDYIIIKSVLKGDTDLFTITSRLKEHFTPKSKHNLAYPGKYTNKGVWGQNAYHPLVASLRELSAEIVMTTLVRDPRSVYPGEPNSLFYDLFYKDETLQGSLDYHKHDFYGLVKELLEHFEREGCFDD